VSCLMFLYEVPGEIDVLRAEGGGEEGCERKLRVETPIRLRSGV
jgi:hypothetical protein